MQSSAEIVPGGGDVSTELSTGSVDKENGVTDTAAGGPASPGRSDKLTLEGTRFCR